MLCEKCTTITFKPFEDCELDGKLLEIEQLNDPSLSQSSVFYFHHEDEGELRRSAASGCHFCVMIMHKLFEGQDHPFYAQNRHPLKTHCQHVLLRKPWPRDVILSSLEDGSRTISDKLEVYCGEQGVITFRAEEDLSATLEDISNALSCSNTIYPAVRRRLVSSNTSETPTSHSQRLSKRLSRLKSGRQPVYHYDPLHPKSDIPIDAEWFSPSHDFETGSAANMSLAAAWLKECATEHDDCSHHGRTVPALPSRVIDVSDPVRPVLKIPHWERKPYVTLSYCWGDSARFMTRKENLEEHKKRLPLESMPKTFRDAIAVTVRLGFRYLWIDAICLVQDWPEDVERGMSNMGAIYRDSFLTISAAGGINVEAGLFVDRDPRWYRPCRLDMNVHATGYSVTRTFYIHGRTIESYLPLNSRGWVLQEQASSRRSLIFGRRMMWWQCACRSLSEEEPRKSSANESNFLATFRIWAIEPKALEKLNQMKSNHFDVWYDIVEKYQTRSLTFITDKLPALSGLAGLLHKRYRCTYLAGLWREDLQVGLCWYLVFIPQQAYNMLKPRTPITDHQAQTPYIAPSWSWVSVHHKHVRFRKRNHDSVQVLDEGALLLDGICHQNSEYQNPFGEVTGGKLRLKGRIREALLYPPAPESGPPFPAGPLHPATVVDPLTERVMGMAALDFECPTDPILVKCLLCQVHEIGGKLQLTCLALQAIEYGKDEYRRIGLIFPKDSKWFGEVWTQSPRFIDRSKFMEESGHLLMNTIDIV